MVDYTNLSQNINLTSFSDILHHANTMTSDTFWTGIYWMFTVIVLISTLAFGIEVAAILAFFSSLILGMLLLYLDLITLTTFGISEAVLIFITIYFMYSSGKSI